MRVLLAPENPAGAAGALRDALRRRGHDADLVVFRPHPFGLPHDRLAATWGARLREGLAAPSRYDVLHFQFGTSLVELLDAAWARARRRLVLMHYWGSDVRTEAVARRLHPARARVVGSRPNVDERTVVRRLRLASRVCRAALVSDLELASYVEPWFDRVYLVPTPLAPPRPGPEPPALPGDGPIVFHAPSDPSIKGTGEVTAAMDRLAERGVLRSRMVTGVPHDAVLAELARADVVVDQLNSETPGVLALEAMALGKPVLLEYRPEALAPFARGAPLVRVTAATLEAELEAICRDPARRAELGEAGRRFVAEVHDADRVAAAVERVYAHAPTAAPGTYSAAPDAVTPLASGAA
jgi:Glycosyl transferases group 1